jgi:hypothetical protein
VILSLTQNGYKIKHFILGSESDNVMNLNEYYVKYELASASAKKLSQLIYDSHVVVINDFDNFEKYTNLEALKGLKNKKGPSSPFPLIMNQKFEVFMSNLNCFYSIFEDKQMLAFSGMLSRTRLYHEYVPPFVPRVNIFVS